jgi:thioredoxin
MAVDVSDSDFDSEVLESSLPVVVDFWADWCAPCKALDPILDELSDDLAGRVKIVKLDAGSNPGVVARYNVRNMPTMILFKNGEPADMKVGAAQSRVGLMKWMESHAA